MHIHPLSEGSFTIDQTKVFVPFNTAIEIDINLTSPDFHPFARDTKDVAAAAVLISVFVSCAIGLFVFLPYMFA